MIDQVKVGAFVSSLVYSFVGVFIFWISFLIIDRLTPYHLWKELVEEKNREEIRYWKYPPFNKDQNWFTPHNLFVALDALLKIYERMPMRVLREKALKKAAAWMLEHLKGSGGLGAIYPAMANSIMALQCLGYDADDPLVVKALREIEDLEVYDSVQLDGRRVPTVHLQPCFSPVWDTALLVNALVEAGMPQDHLVLQKAGAYLMSRQTKTVGDWIVSSPTAQPGGWYFQFENEM